MSMTNYDDLYSGIYEIPVEFLILLKRKLYKKIIVSTSAFHKDLFKSFAKIRQ